MSMKVWSRALASAILLATLPAVPAAHAQVAASNESVERVAEVELRRRVGRRMAEQGAEA